MSIAKAAPATRERPTGPAVATAAAPVCVEEVPVELAEPEVWLLDPDVVSVEKPEDVLVPVVVVPEAVPVVVTRTEVLTVSDPEADPEAELEVVGESGTTGDESPAGMDAGAG